MYSSKQFELSQLRQKNMVVMIESIATFIACLFATAFLPQLLFKYFYATQQLTEEPAIFSYIQVGSFLVGALYFLYAVVGNFQRSMKARKLEKEIQSGVMMGDGCCDDCNGACSCGDHGSCACGCENDITTMSSADTDSAVSMMKKAGGKKKAGKK